MRFVVGAVAAGLLVCVPASAERFSNPVLGLSIEKPNDWHVLSAEANAENLRKVEIGSPEMQEAIRKYASVPLYAFTRYPEPHPDLNASVKVNTRPAGAFVGQSGQQVLEALLPGLSRTMSDLKIVKAPEMTTLAGKPAGHMALTYTLKTDGASYPAASEMWIVPRDDYLIIVGAGYRPAENTGDRKAVIEIVNSLQLSD